MLQTSDNLSTSKNTKLIVHFIIFRIKLNNQNKIKFQQKTKIQYKLLILQTKTKLYFICQAIFSILHQLFKINIPLKKSQNQNR